MITNAYSSPVKYTGAGNTNVVTWDVFAASGAAVVTWIDSGFKDASANGRIVPQLGNPLIRGLIWTVTGNWGVELLAVAFCLKNKSTSLTNTPST